MISLIFGVVDNKDGLVNKLSILGKSISQIRNDLSRGSGLSSFVNTIDITALENFNSKLQQGMSYSTAYKSTLLSCNQSTREQAVEFIKSKKSISDFTQGLNQSTHAAKAGQVALKGLALAGNMIAMWAISAAISAVVKGIDNLANASEHCKERVEELMGSYKSALDSANQNAQKTEELASKYETLSKGVNKLGENVSLTADEYKEYNSLVNQIAEMFPTLISGYTDEGTAILNLKGNVEELRDAYKEAQKEAYNLLIVSEKDSDGNDIITNYQNQVNGKQSWLSKQSSFIDGEAGARDVIEVITRLTGALTPEEFRTAYNDLYEEYKNIWYSDKMQNALKSSGYESFSHLGVELTSEDLAKVKQSAHVTIQTYNAEIESNLNNFKEIANAYLMTNEDYDKMDEQSKKAASLLVNSLNESISNEFENIIDIGTYVSSIINMISTNSEAKEALSKLFTTDFTTLPISESKQQIDDYITTIATLLERDPLELKIEFGFESVDEIEKRITTVNDQIAKGVSGFNMSNGGNSKGYISAMESLDTYTGTLTEENAQKWTEWNGNVTEEFNSVEDRINAFEEFLNSADLQSDKTPIFSVSDTINQLTQLKPAFDSLKSAYQNIFTDDGFTLENVNFDMLEKIMSSFDGMKKLGLDIDYSSIDELAKVLTDSFSTAEQVQEAFNEVATSAVNAGVSGTESFEILKSVLEDFGIENSEMVAFSSLVSNTEALKASGLDLAEASDEVIRAFAEEYVAAENVTQAIYVLTFAKQIASQENMDTSGEVANLKTLAENAGYTGEVIQHLTELEQIYQEIASGTISADNMGSKIARAKELRDLIEGSASKISYEPVKFNGNAGVKSAGAAGKEAADAYLDAFEKELSNLKSLRDRGKITEKQYLDHLRKLYEVYFKNKKKYLDQYQKYEAEYLNGMKSLYESAFSGIISILDKQIAANNKQKDAAIDSLNEQKEAAEESYKAQQKLLDEQIDAIQKQIDIKQKEIDAINDAAEARKKEIELQKAQYELERAKNQRTKYVYKDGGGGYEIDSSAVTDARQNLDDTTRESNISKIEKEISLLEDKIDVLEEQKSAIDTMIESSNAYYDSLIKQSENYWDSIINGLEDYKSRWEELAELEEQAKMVAVLEQLGISTEDILGMSESAFQDFKNNYLNILADMYSGNDQMTKSLSELANVNMGSLNGHLAETQGHIDGLRDIDFKNLTDSIGTMSDRFGEVSESVGNVANAISGSGGGGGSKSSSDSGGSGGKSEPTEGASSSSLKSAVEEQVNGATEQLTKEAELFKGESGIKGAVQEVIDKIGGGDDDKGEDSDTITSAIKNQAETANKLLPKEQILFKDLRDVIGQSKDHLSEIKTMLEDMNGKEFTVTLNVNGGGGGGLPNLPGHANGVKKIGKDETAWTQEAGREMIISPSTGAVLTPLSQGDSVLKNSFTENIFEWAKISPSKLIESFKLNDSLSYIPESKPQTVHVKQNVNITAPYLTNDGGYNRLVNELQGLSTQAYQEVMKR